MLKLYFSSNLTKNLSKLFKIQDINTVHKNRKYCFTIFDNCQLPLKCHEQNFQVFELWKNSNKLKENLLFILYLNQGYVGMDYSQF